MTMKKKEFQGKSGGAQRKNPSLAVFRLLSGLLLLILFLASTAFCSPAPAGKDLIKDRTPPPEETPAEILQFTPTATLSIEESLDQDFPAGNGQPIGMLIGSAILVLIVILGTLFIGPLPNPKDKP